MHRYLLSSLVLATATLIVSCGDDGGRRTTEDDAGVRTGDPDAGIDGGANAGNGGTGGPAGMGGGPAGMGGGAAGMGGAGGMNGGTCGNGVIDPGEDCDGSNLAGATCMKLMNGSGTLGCTADCMYDTSMCMTGTGGSGGAGG